MDVVGAQYAVDINAKRSTHAVDITNMGRGSLPLVQKGQTHTVGYTVGMQYTVCVSA